jgi:flagellar biosynthesis/type III secretory pathway chaperone
MAAGNTTDATLTALQAELDALIAVRDALMAEHDALTESAAARLETAVSEKNVAIAELTARRDQREALLGRDSLRVAVTQFFEEGINRQQALSTVDHLQQLGQECQRLNRRNGLLISGLREMTTSALGILRGESTVRLYGQSGGRDEALGSRVIGTA